MHHSRDYEPVVITNVNRLRIFNRLDGGLNNFDDGFGWILEIDGRITPEIWPDDDSRREKSEKVLIEVDEDVKVDVVWRYGNKETLIPKEFELQVGELVIRTHPSRYPCQIVMGGVELRVRRIEIEFKEGQAVWIDLSLLPVGEVVKVL